MAFHLHKNHSIEWYRMINVLTKAWIAIHTSCLPYSESSTRQRLYWGWLSDKTEHSYFV